MYGSTSLLGGGVFAGKTGSELRIGSETVKVKFGGFTFSGTLTGRQSNIERRDPPAPPKASPRWHKFLKSLGKPFKL